MSTMLNWFPLEIWSGNWKPSYICTVLVIQDSRQRQCIYTNLRSHDAQQVSHVDQLG